MSSIYRKGRDGYYYYQTYIYNPETGKKDKRIFHSLGTKDHEEAEGKQIEYDNKYEKFISGKEDKEKKLFFKYNLKTLIIIAGTVMITFLMMDLFKSKPEIKYNPTDKNEVPDKSSGEISEKIEKNDFVQKDTDGGKKQKENKIINAPKKEEKKPPSPKAVIPKYTVERVDRLSGAFEQGKVYVTVDKSSSNESLMLLCEKLKKRYSEFSNIIICLYTNNATGIALAKGLDEKVSSKEQVKAWLVMYSYNPVEGAYFDNNPSGYLGAY